MKRILYTFILNDSDNLTTERVGFVAAEIAAEQADSQEWPGYTVECADVQDLATSKKYTFQVVSSSD